MTQPVSPEDALKACPFCGDDEELRVCQPLYLSGYWAVHCGCCGGEMQSESRAGAVADWNTRTDPPKTVLEEEEAIEAGVVALRDWMSENWGDIKDGAETGMRGAVRTLISLKDRGTD